MRIIRDKAKLYERLKNIAISRKGKLLSDKYITAKTKYTFECKYGHKFELTADKVIGRGDWCPYCAGRYGNFEEECRHIIEDVHHGKMLSKYVNNNTHIKYMCENGHISYITPANLKAGKWCNKCNLSHGEKAIRYYLDKNNYYYEEEYSFNELKGKRNVLRFDFAVFKDSNKKELLCLIEYDGEQHFRPLRHSNHKKENINKFKTTQLHDNMKNQYCKDNNIPLIRISCFDVDYRRLKNLYNDVKDILDCELLFLELENKQLYM